MKRLDHRVSAVPLGLRREPLDDDSNDQATERHRNRHEPQARAADELDVGGAFRLQSRRVVSGELLEKEPRREARSEREENRRAGAGRAEDDRIEDELALSRAFGG